MAVILIALIFCLVAIVGVVKNFDFRRIPKGLPLSVGLKTEPSPPNVQPVSVNFHFTRKCNYSCGFCFHTQKNSFKLPLEEAKRGFKLLANSGTKKINFAGGEPFLYPKDLGEYAKYCKEELGLESVSIVSNGSKITERWFKKYARYLDILAVSVDSFNEETNIKIGRGKGEHVKHVRQAAQLCARYNVRFKLNTVANRYNCREDMNSMISELNPFRWKVFQVLILAGENSGTETLRDGREFIITNEEFKHFLHLHRSQKALVPEDNSTMKDAYLILDERMCFLDCSEGGKTPSPSILDVGVQKALLHAGFNDKEFKNRGGIYDWKKQDKDNCTKFSGPNYDW